MSVKRGPKEEYSEFGIEDMEQVHGEIAGVSLDCKKESLFSSLSFLMLNSGSYDIDDNCERMRISFVAFKQLVECGMLTKEDLSLMRSAKVIQVPDGGK